MRNRFSGLRGILGTLAVYALGFGGCASPQSTIETQFPEASRQQISAPAPRPKYSFETSDTFTNDHLSYRESENGNSRSIDMELYDTNMDGKTVEQAIVTRRDRFKSEKVMFVRKDSKVVWQPNHNDDVRMMTDEDQELFDGLYEGNSENRED